MYAKVNLFCLPNAGASAAMYVGWRRWLPQWIEVRPLELPGRGIHFNEPLIDTFDRLLDRLAAECPVTGEPYALFGHSMGALLAYALAHRLDTPGPCALMLAGSPAPRLRDPRSYAEPLDDAVLLQHVRALGGTPVELLANAELMQMLLPVIRADFRVCSSYRYEKRVPLSCRIHAFGGRNDLAVGDAIAGWSEETTTDFTLDWFDGGHFFLHDHLPSMLARVAELLTPYRMAKNQNKAVRESACLS